MTEQQKQHIIATSWQLHGLVEQDYLALHAVEGDKDWQEKQRVLLADMALHLLQTALNPGPLAQEKLKNNLYSILTISEQFLPKAALAQAKQQLF